MITRLCQNNYRAFESIDIPLTKINLFFGPNNSGKSSILSAINLLSQTLHSADRDVPLLLDGRFEDLGTYEDVVYGNEVKRNITLGLEFPMKVPLVDWLADVQNCHMDVTFHYRKQRREIVVNSIRISTSPSNIFLDTRVTKTGTNQLIEEVASSFSGVKIGRSSSGSIKLNHYVPSLVPPPGRRWFPRVGSRNPYRLLDMFLYYLARSINQHLGNVEFIGPFRRGPQRTYPFSGETPSTIGVHGEKAIDIIVSDESRRGRKKRQIAQRISRWLQQSEIAKEIDIEVLTERHFEVLLTHFETGERENIADVGYGFSQILPILVAGYHLPNGSTLIIEEPEIHLHPKAAAEVGTFLYEVAQRSIQLFVETHSEHLLLRLQSYVASGDLSAEDVNVFYVYSDKKSRKKICHRIPLGKDGFFTEDWPRGFFPERLKEARNLAKFSV